MPQSVGRVESLARYPVKSMAGHSLPEVFFGYAGVFGDRVCAFRSGVAVAGFPFHTSRQQELMLLYNPQFRAPVTAAPSNLAAAEAIAPGITPVFPDAQAMALTVTTPDGAAFDVHDPALIADMQARLTKPASLTLSRSDRAHTDCRPVSIFSMQTLGGLGEEFGEPLDPRRFRANLYADLDAAPFAERAYVGRRMRVGDKVELAILDNDPRCKVISLCPDTGRSTPKLLKLVIDRHEGEAGLYAAVLVEGLVRAGDPIQLLD